VLTATPNFDPLSTITGTALSAPQEFSYLSYGGALPHAFYYGSGYDTNPNLVVSFTPQELESHYGLTNLIAQGYDGTGQTIALVEGYGYDAALDDANTAATIFGLPQLTLGTTFNTVYPEGPPVLENAADLTGWTEEIALDIQSAHSIAPGANILVVASAGQDNEDQIASLVYIFENGVANVASSSWENDYEFLAGPVEAEAFSAVLEYGAASGISYQFSSGDAGDEGLGPVGDLGIPSDSPYAVAVGGTTILNDVRTGGQQVAGWGNNATYIALGGPADPPFELGFLGGAGGGESIYFAKPSWQKKLPGTGRQSPDVSALADPYTGFAIVFTDAGTQYWQPGIGGTSLASPIFTSIWAIADQYAGWPLGMASIPVSTLKKGQITDVIPNTDLIWSDPHGNIYDSSGNTPYSADSLFTGLLYSQTQFPSAVWPFDSEDAAVLSFGTDSSLTVTQGWDNVTGYGEPNGLPFIQGVTGQTTGAPLVTRVP